MQRVRYEVDPYNRLVIAGQRSGLEKFRQVLDGQFRVGARNNLSYCLRAPLAEGEDIPHQIRIGGNWSLTDRHELQLTLDKEARERFGDLITLQGRILDADKNSLAFSVTTKLGEGKETTYILNLRGLWKADEFNRLSFCVEKETGRYDILTFNGAWEINKGHEIVYRYEKAVLIRKKRESHALTFRGHWDIREKSRISYILDADSASGFDFRAGAGVLEKDSIKYMVGIGLEGRARPVKRAVVLYGEWRLKKDTGILFEIEYSGGRVAAIVFGADVALADRGMVSFKLKSRTANRGLEMALELSQKMLSGGGEIFLRALTSRRELAMYAGAAWRF